MINNIVMKGKDAISAKLAECFVTIEGNRYNFMQMINLKKFEKNKTEFPSWVRLELETRQLLKGTVLLLHIITSLFSEPFCKVQGHW